MKPYLNFLLTKRKTEVKVMKKMFPFLLTVMALSLLMAPQATAIGTPAGTLIENQAYSDYNDANGNALPRVYSNTVTTEVTQVAAVRTTPETATKLGTAGTDVYYAANICNDGNGPDTFDLTAVNDQGWTTTIYKDDNQDGIWDPLTETTEITSTDLVDPDQCESIIVVASVPIDAQPDDFSDTTLTATSQFDPNVSDTSTFTTTALAAALEIVKTASPTTPEDGDIVTYAINGKNLGTETALNVFLIDQIPTNTTYVAGSMRFGPIGVTYETAAALTDTSDGDPGYFNNALSPKQIELTRGDVAPGEGGVLFFQVRVDDDVPAGTEIINTGTATYQLVEGETTYTTNSNESSITVDSDASVLLDPDQATSGNPGDQIVYAFTAYNNGNTTDVIDLTYTSSSGLTWTFWQDVDGNGIPGTDGDFLLTDTDGDGIIDTNSIPQGGSTPILAVATIPAGTSDGTVDSTVVTGTSSVEPADEDGSDIENLTTTVTAPVLALTKTVSPNGPQPPGTELIYTVTVTNNGTGVATTVVITDIVPTYTTYKAGSLKSGSTLATIIVKTDAADGDGAYYDPGSNAVIIPDGNTLSLGPNGTYVLQFTITID